jgi:hypothetical protein
MELREITLRVRTVDSFMDEPRKFLWTLTKESKSIAEADNHIATMQWKGEAARFEDALAHAQAKLKEIL